MRFLILILLCFLIGCSTEEVGKIGVNDEPLGTSIQSIVEAQEVQTPPDTMLAEKTFFDFDGDGVEETIELYVSPAPVKVEQDGQTLWGWEDSHLWQLIVRFGEQTYPIYNYSPHFATLNFWIVDKEIPEIVLMLSGRELALYCYAFDKENRQFILTDFLEKYDGTLAFRSTFPD